MTGTQFELESLRNEVKELREALSWLAHELDPPGGPTTAQHARWLAQIVLTMEYRHLTEFIWAGV